MAKPIILDAGALISIERGNEELRAQLRDHARRGGRAILPTPIVAEVWRGGSTRQARLADFLKDGLRSGYLHIVPLDYELAKRVGVLLGQAKMSVADGTVCACAQDTGGGVITSDPRDVQRVIPRSRIRVV